MAKKLKLYLATLYSRREEMEKIADELKKHNFDICARWVYGGEEGLSREQISIIDLEDVDAADVVLSFTSPHGTPTTGGGRHVEFGYALAKGKRVALIGDRENIFHHHPSVDVYQRLDDWIYENI